MTTLTLPGSITTTLLTLENITNEPSNPKDIKQFIAQVCCSSNDDFINFFMHYLGIGEDNIFDIYQTFFETFDHTKKGSIKLKDLETLFLLINGNKRNDTENIQHQIRRAPLCAFAACVYRGELNQFNQLIDNIYQSSDGGLSSCVVTLNALGFDGFGIRANTRKACAVSTGSLVTMTKTGEIIKEKEYISAFDTIKKQSPLKGGASTTSPHQRGPKETVFNEVVNSRNTNMPKLRSFYMKATKGKSGPPDDRYFERGICGYCWLCSLPVYVYRYNDGSNPIYINANCGQQEHVILE